MCGPLEYCFCFPIKTGVRCISVALALVELGLAIHNGILVKRSEVAFYNTTGGQDVDHHTIQLIMVIGFYTITILANIVLLIGTFKEDRWMVLVWLVVYALTIVGSVFAAPLIFIWFVVIQPFPLFSLLAVVPILLALLLTFLWVVVNGYFVRLGLEHSQNKKEADKP